MLKFNSKVKKGQLLPSYPLFVKDPFFSIWSPADKLNESDTAFWTGKMRQMHGFVSCDGKVYSFMGANTVAEKMTQTYVDVTAFDTKYGFTCPDFDLDIIFTSPLNPDDLELLSCPVCFFRYTVTPKKNIGKLTVALFAHQDLCYDNIVMPVRGGRHILSDGTQAAWFGLKKQLVMSQSFDDSCAEWGYYYLTGKRAFCATAGAFERFVKGGPLEYIYVQGQTQFLVASDEYEDLSEKTSGLMTMAFDDTCSVFYFGDWLKGYYFEKTGKNIIEAIEDSIANADKIFAKCDAFDRKLRKMAKPYGEDYLLVLYGGLRQAVAAHKLVMDRKGNLLFLSKENHSNGCMATVDVSYPSIPLFLLFNPALVRANSKCLSADVAACYDPNFAEVFEKNNTAMLNCGVVLTKYTGSRGKGGTNDASAEFIGWLRGIMAKDGVVWQSAELGKVDAGGGGTVAKYISKHNIETIDLGVPLLAMHAPYELAAKVDVYETHKAVKAFYNFD